MSKRLAKKLAVTTLLLAATLMGWALAASAAVHDENGVSLEWVPHNSSYHSNNCPVGTVCQELCRIQGGELTWMGQTRCI